jgi:hypothetical protein
MAVALYNAAGVLLLLCTADDLRALKQGINHLTLDTEHVKELLFQLEQSYEARHTRNRERREKRTAQL